MPPASGGTLEVYVTDAPPRDEVTGILVTVSGVQVHRAVTEQETEQDQEQTDGDNQTQQQEQQQTEQGDGGWINIDLGDNATTFDLLQIRGIEQFLGSSTVEAGKYTQVRLAVDTVQVALGDGQPQDAEVSSKELKIVRPFDIVAGETTLLVLDFEADKMVTVTGADKIIVKPVVKLSVRQGKAAGQKDEEDTPEGAAEQVSVEIDCDQFTENKHINSQVEVNAGDTIRVVLCSNPTTGFKWSEVAQIGDQAIIDQMEHEFIPPGNQSGVGAAGQEVWIFRALKEGTTTVSVEYSRPWEGGEKGEWTFELTVVVK